MGEEVRKERMRNLLDRVRELESAGTDRELSEVVGLSQQAIQRIREGRSGSLRGANCDNFCGYLKITPEDLDRYLKGELGLDYVIGSNERDNSLKEADAVRKGDSFVKDVLPYLPLSSLFELLKAVQGRLFALLPDYQWIRKGHNNELSQGKIDQIKEALRGRGPMDPPSLTLLAHDLDVDINTLTALYKEQQLQ